MALDVSEFAIRVSESGVRPRLWLGPGRRWQLLLTLCASIKGTTNKSYWTSADTWSIIDPRFPKMIELLRLVLPGAIGWLTAKSAYTLLSPGFVQRRPAVAACVVGSMMGLAIPAAMIALSRLA